MCALYARLMRFVMARPKTYRKPTRTHLTLDASLKSAAAKYAFSLDLRGGMTELVTRLLERELAARTLQSARESSLS